MKSGRLGVEKRSFAMALLAILLHVSVAIAQAAKQPEKVDYDLLPWSFRPLVKPAVPALKNATWPRADLDRFSLAKLEQKGIQPNPDADRRTLLRRLSF